MTTESFRVYTTQPELDARDGRVNWFGSAFMMHKRGQVYTDLDFTPEDVQWLADLVNTGNGVFRTEDGGIREITLVVGQPFVLDFEYWMQEADRDKFIAYIRAFRALAPNVKIGFYPSGWLYNSANPFWPNNDMLYRGESRALRRFDEAMEAFRPIADLLDFVSPSIYPLEKEAERRDLYCNRLIVGLCRRFGKPVLPFMFGGWRDFRGDGIEKLSKMTITKMSQYAEIAREECDGAIVWGKWKPNQTLIDLLER